MEMEKFTKELKESLEQIREVKKYLQKVGRNYLKESDLKNVKIDKIKNLTPPEELLERFDNNISLDNISYKIEKGQKLLPDEKLFLDCFENLQGYALVGTSLHVGIMLHIFLSNSDPPWMTKNEAAEEIHDRFLPLFSKYKRKNPELFSKHEVESLFWEGAADKYRTPFKKKTYISGKSLSPTVISQFVLAEAKRKIQQAVVKMHKAPESTNKIKEYQEMKEKEELQGKKCIKSKGRRRNYFQHPQTGEKLYFIDYVASLLRVSPTTLRNFEKQGIFTPKRYSDIFGRCYTSPITHQERNLRLYSQADIEKLKEMLKQKISAAENRGAYIGTVARMIAKKKEIDKESAVKWLKRTDEKLKPERRGKNKTRYYPVDSLKKIPELAKIETTDRSAETEDIL
jgi:DNA-binding transcriptional MerR regulator